MNHSDPNIQDDVRQAIAEIQITRGIDVTGATAATVDTTHTAVTKQEPCESPAKKQRVGADQAHSFIQVADITQEITERVPLLSVNGKKGKLALCICASEEIYIVNDGAVAHTSPHGAMIAGFYKGKWVADITGDDTEFLNFRSGWL